MDIPEKVAEKLLAQEHVGGRRWLHDLMDATPDKRINRRWLLRIVKPEKKEGSPFLEVMQQAVANAESTLSAIPGITLGKSSGLGLIRIESGATAKAIVKALELDCVAGVIAYGQMELIRPPRDEDAPRRSRGRQ